MKNKIINSFLIYGDHEINFKCLCTPQANLAKLRKSFRWPRITKITGASEANFLLSTLYFHFISYENVLVCKIFNWTDVLKCEKWNNLSLSIKIRYKILQWKMNYKKRQQQQKITSSKKVKKKESCPTFSYIPNKVRV